MHEFLTNWADFEPSNEANLLTGDELLLKPDVLRRHVVLHHSWDNFVGQEEFGHRDNRLHLSLLPQPFFGDVARARVVILTLNPGLHPIDYYAEFCVREYKQAALDSLRRQFNPKYPFIWFDPRFSWHSGFSYWHGRFAGLVNKFAVDLGIRRAKALSFFAKSVATLELLPYHSKSFGLPRRIMNKLPSVRLARSFVSDVLEPRAQSGEVQLVVTRKAKLWGLSENRKTIVYKGSESRGAYLTPQSRGGKAILKQLKALWPE